VHEYFYRQADLFQIAAPMHSTSPKINLTSTATSAPVCSVHSTFWPKTESFQTSRSTPTTTP
jgi:hypothetical protein